jgi:hypothetical protein
MLEKTTCEKFCQKRPITGGGTAGQATRGTCRLGRRRHEGAATSNTGTWPRTHIPIFLVLAAIVGGGVPIFLVLAAIVGGGMPIFLVIQLASWSMPSPRMAAGPTAPRTCPHAGVAGGGTLMPASAQAACATCRLCRHRRGSFLTNFFTVGLF